MSLYEVPKDVNIEATAQRTDVLHFMNVTDMVESPVEGEAYYQQLGAGFTAMTESPNAQTKERKYINEKSSRKNITSYAPNYAFENLLMFNNPAIRKIYKIYKHRKTGTDAVVEMVSVDAFETAKGGYFPAYKGKYAVEVSSCDDDDDMIIKGNLNGQGDEEIGWFNPTEGKWSDKDPSELAASQSDTKTAEEASSDNSEQSDSTVTETGTDETENT